MNPSQGQFDNVVSFEQKKERKNQDAMAAKSPFGPIQSKLVKPVTEAPSEDRALANPGKETQMDEDKSNV
jgi:hypothetical protein